ncbi:translesion error-prone DNA polymerase V autoproteolytic subunit [Hyphomicrobium sp.]|uniref:LexA family protein n=1 Tax=Hyphomicrobium sp. TaxID=82 RepID=UPI0025BDF57F|nr:translesion error-prone DNA polymerase V autoproteolytic subunit [Hyphomicrobium sp.]
MKSSLLTVEVRTSASVAFALASVPAGFPSPAEEYLDRPLDFNELLIEQPAATFAVRVTGDSMIGAGIFPGDIAIVNRAASPIDRSIILAILDGEFTIKRFRKQAQLVWLEAENANYARIDIGEAQAFEVFGVIKRSIRMHAL